MPTILLPAPEVDLTKFAVIACDQHSAEPAYWDETEKQVGDAPSALRMILPEAWLQKDTAPKKETLWQTMETYCRDGVLRACPEGFLYLRRRTVSGVRRGADDGAGFGSIQLYPRGKNIDSGNGTDGIRPLATPGGHPPGGFLGDAPVMVLIDDRDDRLMQQMEACVAGQPALYDFELMQGGGHLTGVRRTESGRMGPGRGHMEELLANSRDGLLFAVGDGNHSLARPNVVGRKKRNLSPKERKPTRPGTRWWKS